MVDSVAGGRLWPTNDAKPSLTRTGHHAGNPGSHLDAIGHAHPGNSHTGTDDAFALKNTITGATIADCFPDIGACGALNGGGRSNAGTHGG